MVEFTVLAQKFSVITQKECCQDGWVLPLKDIARWKQHVPPHKTPKYLLVSGSLSNYSKKCGGLREVRHLI